MCKIQLLFHCSHSTILEDIAPNAAFNIQMRQKVPFICSKEACTKLQKIQLDHLNGIVNPVCPNCWQEGRYVPPPKAEVDAEEKGKGVSVRWEEEKPKSFWSTFGFLKCSKSNNAKKKLEVKFDIDFEKECLFHGDVVKKD